MSPVEKRMRHFRSRIQRCARGGDSAPADELRSNIIRCEVIDNRSRAKLLTALNLATSVNHKRIDLGKAVRRMELQLGKCTTDG